MIEEGWVEHPILEATLREYVRGEAESGQSGVVLLGCTHYPWIQAAVERALPSWSVVNPASEVAREARILLGRSAGPELALERTPVVRWCFTDPAVVPAFASSRFEPSQGAPVLAT
jgi:glutamate racemase